MLGAGAIHLNAISYMSQQSTLLETEALTVVKKPKYIDAEELSDSASSAMGTIICAYAMLEAQINHFVDWSHNSIDSKCNFFSEAQLTCVRKATAVPGFERIETLKKYQEILRIADLAEFDADREPYQSVDLLRRLRNFLVHLKPNNSKSFVDEAAKIRRGLESRKIEFHMSRSRMPPDAFLSAQCASWAYTTAVQFVESFIRRIEDG